MIDYRHSYGYESKTNSDLLFKTKEAAKAHDLSFAVETLGFTCPEVGSDAHKAIAFFAEYLAELERDARIAEYSQLKAAE